MEEKGISKLTLGEIQDMLEMQKEQIRKKDKEIEELKKRLSDGGAEQKLKVQSNNYKEALETVYEIISSLEKYTTEEVLFYAAQMLADVMDCKDVAIYTVADRKYARLFSATSPEARKLGNSIEYIDMGNMYSDLKKGQIYMNKDMKADFPSMACAVYAEERMQVIMMIWGIPYGRMTLSEANCLAVVETLLQNAILRASRHMASFRRKRYIEGTSVLKEEAFKILIKAFFEAKAKGLTECTLVEIVMSHQNYESISLQVACNIRQTDYMGVMEGGKLYILLSNTNMKNAEIFQERLQSLGYKSLLKENVV